MRRQYWLILIFGICSVASIAQTPSSSQSFVFSRMLTVDGNSTMQYDIFYYDLGAGHPMNLTDHVANDIAFAWSHDGEFIFFTSDRDAEDGNHDLYRMRVDGTEILNLTNTPTTREMNLIYLPTGDIQYTINRVDEFNRRTAEAYVVDPDTAESREIPTPTGITSHSGDARIVVDGDVYQLIDSETDEIELVFSQFDNIGRTSPTWSPDDEYIAFIDTVSTSQVVGRGLYLVDRNDTTRQTLYEEDNHTVIEIMWAPFGNQIAFTSRNDTTLLMHLFVVDLQTHMIRQISQPTTHARRPTWSPTSLFITYLCDGLICLFDTQTQTTEQITDNQTDTAPIWRPL